MVPKPPAEAAPAKAALSIVGAITAALFAVAYAVSQQRHDNAPRFDPRYCEGGLRPRPAWALSQPSVFLFFHKLSGLVQGLVDEHKKATSFKNKDSPSPRMGTLAEDEA